MNLLSDEKVILESKPKGLVLTTHRVRSTTTGVGNRATVSIMLEELSSCALTYKSQTSLLVLAAVVMAFSFVVSAQSGGRDGSLMIGTIVSVILLVIYAASRQQIIELSSSGAAIKRKTKGMSSREVEEFIDMVEAAKDERYRTVRYQERQREFL